MSCSETLNRAKNITVDTDIDTEFSDMIADAEYAAMQTGVLV